MSVGTGAALAIGAGVSAAGALGGAALSSSAAGNAANAQANAAEQGTAAQVQLGQENLGLQSQIFNTQQANEKPFLEAGQNAIARINSLTGQDPLSSAPAANQAPVTVPGLTPQPANVNELLNKLLEAHPSSLVPRAKGGPVTPNYMRAAQHYIVGEKGPEELTMFPNGTGWVTPHNQLPKYLSAVHRAGGGVVGGGGPQQATQPTGTVGGQGPATNTTTNTNPWSGDPNGGNDANNPLVSGGSGTPSQNSPFTNWTEAFQAPTAAQAEQYPGYQFQLQQGEQAIQNSAAATGELLDPNTQRSLINYAENAGTADYNNVYNQALQQYQQNYNIFSNNQANQWNRLAATAGIGQTSAGQLNSADSNFGTNAGNTLLNTGNAISTGLNNAAAATASGYVGSANAYSGALGTIGNAAQLPLYMQLLNQQNQYGSNNEAQYS